MRRLAKTYVVAALAVVCSGTAAAHPGDSVALVDLAARERGGLSRVMVLGTAHLDALPEGFDMDRFAPLITRLAVWSPDRIAVEALDGPQCEYLRTYAFAYPGTAEGYCPDPTPAQAALGLTMPQAMAEISATLARPAADRPPETRRRLALLFLAAGDPASAAVQWLRLPTAERRAGGPLTAAQAERLNRALSGRNENVVIAARLAAHLGHDRVWTVDDHTGDSAGTVADEAAYARDITAIWTNAASAERRAGHEAWAARLAGGAPVIGWYRELNSLHEQRLALTGDFGAAAGSHLPGGAGRSYLAYWETRNLRMAANIRAMIPPGGRVLALVGASHKPYYERYLGMTSDLEIAPVEPLLGD